MAAVTKYDLHNQLMIFFIATLTQPKRPISPDDVSRFTIEAALKLANFDNSPNQLYTFRQYIIDQANYWGIDIPKALQWMQRNPAVAKMFLDYAKQNITIVHADFGDVVNEVFSWIGKTVGSGLSSLIGPVLKSLLPIAIIGLGGYIVFKETQKRYR